ncbi:arylsulfatase I-like [Ctenocephalides felis]|uniref:arylsulfatase I-like n=1 Tax=Ctenocephalides felis TaxID=7515 RepID=UPI000E6E4423|nr:arylsulfatase I-like [Ctenocephalides felis]
MAIFYICYFAWLYPSIAKKSGVKEVAIRRCPDFPRTWNSSKFKSPVELFAAIFRMITAHRLYYICHSMLSRMDDAVGELIDALSRKDMLKDSIIVFSTDNGGPAAGFNINAASNWPLRGVKNTLFEGGVRGAGLIWSPLIQKKQRISKQKMHISDWMPTLLSAIKANISIKYLDGMDVWRALSEDTQSPRSQILLNIDDIYGNAGVTDGKYKLLKGNTYNGVWDKWFGPSGRNKTYDVDLVLSSKAGKALGKIGYAPTPDKIRELRDEADVKCPVPESATVCDLKHAPCLFDLELDPCEYNNLADSEPELLNKMLKLLNSYNLTAVPPTNLPDDRRADPRFWDHTWANFGDITYSLNSIH